MLKTRVPGAEPQDSSVTPDSRAPDWLLVKDSLAMRADSDLAIPDVQLRGPVFGTSRSTHFRRAQGHVSTWAHILLIALQRPDFSFSHPQRPRRRVHVDLLRRRIVVPDFALRPRRSTRPARATAPPAAGTRGRTFSFNGTFVAPQVRYSGSTTPLSRHTAAASFRSPSVAPSHRRRLRPGMLLSNPPPVHVHLRRVQSGQPPPHPVLDPTLLDCFQPRSPFFLLTSRSVQP